MEILRVNVSDKENSLKYVLKIQDIEIGCGYIFNREINPIEIYIYEEYQSNGYGKILFKALLEIVKEQGVMGMIFELEEYQFRFINIISQSGALQIGRNDSKIKYLLKIQ